MIVLGIGVSHAPGMLLPAEMWPEMYQRMTRGVGQPAAAQSETEQANATLKARIDDALATLRHKLAEVEPDLVIIVGDDQDEVFGRPFNPTLAVFCGESVEGDTMPRMAEQPGLNFSLTLKGAPGDFGHDLAAGLVKRGFDPAVMLDLHPLGRSTGIGHAFTRPAHFLGLADADIPVLPVFLNCYHPPLPTAARCLELGAAIAEIVATRPERVAIVASGGLSHDPGGPRSGWIDFPLDRWVLDCIAEGRGAELSKLFGFDSDTFHGGTGEIRSWITVAGAFGDQCGHIVDYVPLHQTVTGLGFAYWEPEHAAPLAPNAVRRDGRGAP